MLDNAVWHALTTRHAHFAEVVGRARRYDTDVSVFCGVEGFDEGAWDDLTSLVGREGSAFLFRSRAAPPDGWTVQMEGTGHQMVLEALRPVDVPPVRRLEAADVPQMLELVAIAQPGPFLPRTIELGDYYGVFDDGRLVAMAGERLRLPGLTEVSAVCTHPDARRRGLASGLSARVAAGILDRGELPFLHHTVENHDAQRVYENLGFVFRTVVTFTDVRPPAPPR